MYVQASEMAAGCEVRYRHVIVCTFHSGTLGVCFRSVASRASFRAEVCNEQIERGRTDCVRTASGGQVSGVREFCRDERSGSDRVIDNQSSCLAAPMRRTWRDGLCYEANWPSWLSI